MAGQLSEELSAKYLLVKQDIIDGMRVNKALKKHGLDHGSYYGRREQDPDPIKKFPGNWSRKPKNEKKAKKAPASTSFIIPLAQNTAPSPKTAPPSTGKIAVIVCEADQLNNILQGLGR